MYKQPVGRLIVLILTLAASRAVAASATPLSTPPAGVTLADCYEKSRQISETIGISAETVKLYQAQYRSQVGAILPHIDWIRTQFYQEKVPPTGSDVGQSSLRSEQALSYFRLRQPIFAGFREWAAAGIAKSQKVQAVQLQHLNDLQLLSDVSEAFYIAYALQDALHVLKDTRKINQNQVNQLNRWKDIGRSRPSEVLSAETQAASLDAQIEDTLRSWIEARHFLFYLTGVPPDVPLIDQDLTSLTVSIEEALLRAGKRPEVLAAIEDVRQADLGRTYARGAHYPTLALTANYYTERSGFISQVDWDATFGLDVPIFSGGSTQADVNAARSREIISKLNLSRIQRLVERNVRAAYDNYTHSYSKSIAYEKAVNLAQRNYETQQGEYRLGAISNLELLRLLSDTENLRRLSLAAHAGARIDAIRLRIAMGESL